MGSGLGAGGLLQQARVGGAGVGRISWEVAGGGGVVRFGWWGVVRRGEVWTGRGPGGPPAVVLADLRWFAQGGRTVCRRWVAAFGERAEAMREGVFRLRRGGLDLPDYQVQFILDCPKIGGILRGPPREVQANLRDPDYVRFVCGTLDGLSRPFAGLVRLGQATARPALDRYARNCALRRRVNQWPQKSGNGTTPSQPTFLKPPAVAAPNRIVTR